MKRIIIVRIPPKHQPKWMLGIWKQMVNQLKKGKLTLDEFEKWDNLLGYYPSSWRWFKLGTVKELRQYLA